MPILLAGIDIGGTMIKGALFNEHAELIKRFETPSFPDKDSDKFIKNIISFINSMTAQKISAVGIGIAGLLDPSREVLMESPNLPRLKNLPLKSRISAKLNMPVSIENDANIAALGELSAGEGKTIDNFLLMTMGTGLGSGLVMNRQLVIGESGKGGEFGHMIVQPDGELCGCGKKGCLEAYASGSAMIRMAKTALKQGRPSLLMDMYQKDPDLITPKAIYTAAEDNDALAQEIFRTTAKYLAIGISNVNNLLDIHTFIIGGGVSKASHIFREGLLHQVRDNVFAVSRDKIKIRISKLGNDAGILGAGYLAQKVMIDE